MILNEAGGDRTDPAFPPVYLAVVAGLKERETGKPAVRWAVFTDGDAAQQWVRTTGLEFGRWRVGYVLMLGYPGSTSAVIWHRSGVVSALPRFCGDSAAEFPGLVEVVRELSVRSSQADPSDTPTAVLSRLDRAALAAEQFLGSAAAARPLFFGDSDPLDPGAPPPTDVPSWGPLYRIEEKFFPAGEEANVNNRRDLEFSGVEYQALTGNQGDGVVVAVLDTGFDQSHFGLYGDRLRGLSAVPGVSWDRDESGHGTGCGGIVGGLLTGQGGSIRWRGVATKVGVLVIRVLGRGGWGTDETISRGILAAVAAKVDVITMSIGGQSSMPLTEGAIRKAIEAGIVVVAAAGNDGPSSDSVDYPGRMDGVITVAAADSRTNPPSVASFSSRGPSVDTIASGVSVYMPWANGGWATVSGTSMATPIVAGVIARAIGDLPTHLDTPGNRKRIPSLVLQACDDSIVSGAHPTAQGAGVLLYDRLTRLLADEFKPVDPPPPPPGREFDVVRIGTDDLMAFGTAQNILDKIGTALADKGACLVAVDGSLEGNFLKATREAVKDALRVARQSVAEGKDVPDYDSFIGIRFAEEGFGEPAPVVAPELVEEMEDYERRRTANGKPPLL